MEPVQTTNIVDVYVNYLRRKLDDMPPGTSDPDGSRPGLHDSFRIRNLCTQGRHVLAITVVPQFAAAQSIATELRFQFRGR